MGVLLYAMTVLQQNCFTLCEHVQFFWLLKPLELKFPIWEERV